MSEHPKSSVLSLKVMMLILFVVMALAGGIAYLLVYRFFPHQHISSTSIARHRTNFQQLAEFEAHYFGDAMLARSAIITGISSTTG